MKASDVTALLVTVSIALLGAGCKEEPEVVVVPPAAQSSDAAISMTPQGSEAVAPPPVAAATTAPIEGASAPGATAEVPSKDALETVTRALQSFYVAHDRAPKSLDELLASGFLRKLPAPPAGKKYVYKPEIANIALEDQ